MPIPKDVPFTIGYTFEGHSHTYLPDIVGTLKGEFKTSMGLDRMRSLLSVASAFDLANIKQIVLYVPTYTSYDHGPAYGGQSVIVPHWNQILPVVKANFP